MARFILVFYFVFVQREIILCVSRNFGNLHSADQHGPMFLNNARKGISAWSSDEYIEMSQSRKYAFVLVSFNYYVCA